YSRPDHAAGGHEDVPLRLGPFAPAPTVVEAEKAPARRSDEDGDEQDRRDPGRRGQPASAARLAAPDLLHRLASAQRLLPLPEPQLREADLLHGRITQLRLHPWRSPLGPQVHEQLAVGSLRVGEQIGATRTCGGADLRESAVQVA